MPPDHMPAEFGLLPANADEYVITSGAMKGLRGVFTRDKSGAVVGIDLAGRLFSRVPTPSRPPTHSPSSTLGQKDRFPAVLAQSPHASGATNEV
jgi:hypothetical protein